MKCALIILLLAIPVVIGQTVAASIAGTVLDANTQKPIPAALVMAVPNAPPPLRASTRSGADGAFRLEGLPAGSVSLCVQVSGDEYLDPCQWNASPTPVTLVAGQAAAGVLLRLTSASVVHIQVQDAQKVLNQQTKDGRHPELTLGVWGPNGLFYPAHASRSSSGAGNLQSGIAYQIAIPRDTALKFHISSRDLKLGDEAGASLPGNAPASAPGNGSQQTFQQTFQHNTGDPNPKSFAFTVLGLLP